MNILKAKLIDGYYTTRYEDCIINMDDISFCRKMTREADNKNYILIGLKNSCQFCCIDVEFIDIACKGLVNILNDMIEE